MASDCKSAALKCFVGSNPTLRKKYVIYRFKHEKLFQILFHSNYFYFMQKIKFLAKEKKYLIDSSFDFSQDLSLVDLSLEQLIDSDFHLGSRFNSYDRLNFLYLFVRRFDFTIINLHYTLYNFKLAIYFISFIVSRRGKILFYDGASYTQTFISFVGATSKQYYINQKWIAGLLTNFKEFYPAVFTGVSKHFRFSVEDFSGMKYIHRPPNVSCLLNITRESSAFLENFRLGIPTVALVNINESISGVTFPIFGNNLSPYTYITFLSIIRSAILNGYKHEVYKFYRKLVKKLIKLRYVRYFFSRRIRHKTLTLQLRLFLFRFLFKHASVIFNFFRFCIFTIHPDPEKLFLASRDHFLYSEFYNAFPFLKTVLLNFFNEFFFPLLSSFFSFNFLLRHSFINKLDNSKSFEESGKMFRFNFLQMLYLSFSSEQKFCNICFKLLNLMASTFFSNNFFYFIDIFLSRYIPLLFFLFKAFINFDDKFKKSEMLDFFKTVRLFCVYIYVFKFHTILQSAKSFMQAAPSNFLLSHYISEYFPMIQYKSLGFPDLRTSHFLKLLNFKVSGFPFIGFNVHSFYNLGKFVFNFKKVYGLFRFLKFSKHCKRSFRLFFRSFSFFKFLFKNVYPKSRIGNLFFDLKRSKYVLIPYRFSKFNSNRSFFKSRYLNVSQIMQSIKREKNFSGQLRNIVNKYNLFLLNYRDEEFDTSKFPFNNEFFYFQSNYSSVFLARQFQRNRRLHQRRASISKGFMKFRGSVKSVFRLKKYSIKRSRFYFYFALKHISFNRRT